MECKHVFTMCRLCLRESESFINIFQVDEWFGYVAAEVISDLLQFQVSETDGYPHVVCSICLRKLTDFKEFKDQCQNSRHTYNNVFAADESHEEHPIDIVPSASIKSEPEQGMKDVDISTEAELVPANWEEEETITDDIPPQVELRPVKSEPKDPLDTEESRQEVGKCSSAHTSQEYLGRRRKRTRSESNGPCAGAEVGKMDVKVWRDCESPGERTDMLPDEESDLNSVELSVVELRRGTIEMQEEAICVDTSVDVTREDDGTLEFKIERNCDAERGSARERGEEAPLGVEEREENREHFRCHDCGKGFQEKDVLLRHLELHGYVVNEECCIEERDSQVDTNVSCGTKRKTSDSLEKGSNGKVERVEEIARYVCDICRKGFKRKDNLEVHLRVHSGDKPYNCDICGKRFSDTSSLRTHKFIHTGEKPFMCQVCGTQFAHKCILKYHERTHSGEKPYQCETCGKKYSHGASLKTHRRLHSGEKPFMCEVCGKDFADQHYLKVHARVHTGEKPYKCEICGKTFSVKSTLTQHKRVHSGEKPFSCQVCNKCFPGRTGLRKHLRVHSQ